MENRRVNERLSERNAVSITVVDSPSKSSPRGTHIFGVTRDISNKGLCILLDDFIPESSELNLRVAMFEPPIGFVLKSRITWVNETAGDYKYAVGAEITGCEEQDQHVWKHIIRDKLGSVSYTADSN